MSEYGYIEPPGTRRPTKKRRNARARYQLTELGTSSLGTYREQVADAQTHGRETLEAALDAGRLGDLVEEGFLELDEAGLRATENGRQRLNALLAHLLK